VALSSEHGFPFWLELGTVLLGWSLAALGDARHGLDLIKKGVSVSSANGSGLVAATDLTNLAECYAALGHAADGLSCLDEAAQIIDTMGQRVWEVDMFRVRGALLSATGDRDAAEKRYQRDLASGTASRKHLNCAPPPALAPAGRDQGKRTEARRHARASPYGSPRVSYPGPASARALANELASRRLWSGV
jgi:ATP/maltotriose-dependent transcriptional regulator MalT